MANDAAAPGKLRAMTHAALDEDLPGLDELCCRIRCGAKR